MFKHILLPTDGSPLSAAAIPQALAFAQSCGARVTAVHVVTDYHVFSCGTDILAETRQQYLQQTAAHARGLLADISKLAKEQGVRCDTVALQAEEAYEAMLSTAREQGCDLICMAAHGRHGNKSLPLGSETQKVLAHSHIPVLVFR